MKKSLTYGRRLRIERSASPQHGNGRDHTPSLPKFISITAVLLCTPLMAQTVTTQPVVVTTTAPVTNSLSASCTVPKNGGKCTFNFPAQTLAPLTVKVPGQIAPVSLSGFTGSFTCAINANSTVIVNPDGTKTITGVMCSVVTK